MSCINALEYLLRSIEERDLESYTLAGIISLLESLNYVYRECDEVREDEREDVILLLEEIHRVAYWGDIRRVLEPVTYCIEEEELGRCIERGSYEAMRILVREVRDILGI